LAHELGLDGPRAAHAPVGDGHFLDHAELDFVDRCKLRFAFGHEGLEESGVLAFDHDGLGKQSVAEPIRNAAHRSMARTNPARLRYAQDETPETSSAFQFTAFRRPALIGQARGLDDGPN
jgi:hypothetical protein